MVEMKLQIAYDAPEIPKSFSCYMIKEWHCVFNPFFFFTHILKIDE